MRVPYQLVGMDIRRFRQNEPALGWGPPVSDTRPRSHRTALIDATRRLALLKGFPASTVDEICELAGVTKGSFYHHFESKEALGNAVYRRCKSEMKRILVDDAPRGVTPREEFAHWWRGLWRFASEDPLAFAFLETHRHEPYLDAESRAAGEAITAAAVAVIRRGQRAGAIRKLDAAALIAMVFGAFTGLVKAAGEGGIRMSPRSAAETEACVWEMLRA